MKRLILNITLLIFMTLSSVSAMAHDSKVNYGIAISHDGEQIAYSESGSGDTTLIFIHGWSLDSRLWQNQVSEGFFTCCTAPETTRADARKNRLIIPS
ncbi:alpha/beta hydrolase [Vibrio sp. SG41-7]|nr:alpha/beta hydrolase [Vibrio sp. SG41-7]